MFTAPPLGTTMRRAGSVRGELYPVIHYLTYLTLVLTRYTYHLHGPIRRCGACPCAPANLPT